MKLTIDTDYCPVRNFDDVCSLCNCECISGEALTRDCPLIRNGGTPCNPTEDAISREVINSEIEKRYCNKHCVVPSEEPYCPDNCPARFLKNIVKECPPVEHSLLPLTSEAENLDYQRAVEDTEYCERHEPTYNPDDGSM